MSSSRHINKTVKIVQKLLADYNYTLDIELHKIKIEIQCEYLDENYKIIYNALKQYYLSSCSDYKKNKITLFIRSFI
jgi:hypothetical protein